MTWPTRILAILNILVAVLLTVLAGVAIEARLAWTKALAELESKYRDGEPTSKIVALVGEVSKDDLTRIRDRRVSRELDATIAGLVEMLKDPNQRTAILAHLRVEHAKMADDLQAVFDGNDPEADQKARKIMQEALADLSSDRQQRLDAARVLFEYVFESTVVAGFASQLGAARERELQGGDKVYSRMLESVREDLPRLYDPLSSSLLGKTPDESPPAAKKAVEDFLATWRGKEDRRREAVHMVFMILAAHAPRDEFIAAMNRLPAEMAAIQQKIGPELAVILMDDFNRYLGPRLGDEMVRLRERGLAQQQMIGDLQRQIAFNQQELARLKKIRTDQEALTRSSGKHIEYRQLELAELNILIEEAMAARMLSINRLAELKALLQLRAGQYDRLKQENEALEDFIQKAEEKLKPSRVSY